MLRDNHVGGARCGDTLYKRKHCVLRENFEASLQWRLVSLNPSLRQPFKASLEATPLIRILNERADRRCVGELTTVVAEEKATVYAEFWSVLCLPQLLPPNFALVCSSNFSDFQSREEWDHLYKPALVSSCLGISSQWVFMFPYGEAGCPEMPNRTSNTRNLSPGVYGLPFSRRSLHLSKPAERGDIPGY